MKSRLLLLLPLVLPGLARAQPRTPELLPKVLEEARSRSFTLEAPSFDARAARGKTVVYLEMGDRDAGAELRASTFSSVLRSFGVRVVAPVLRKKGEARLLEAREHLRQSRGSVAVVVNTTPFQTELLGATVSTSGGSLLPFWNTTDRASLGQLVQMEAGFDFTRIGQSLAAAALEHAQESTAVTTAYVNDHSNEALLIERAVQDWLARLAPRPTGTLQLILKPERWQETLRGALAREGEAPSQPPGRTLITLGAPVTEVALRGLDAHAPLSVIAYPLTRDAMAALFAPGPLRAVVGCSERWLAYAMADQALRVLVGAPRLKDEQVPAVLFDRDHLEGLARRGDPEPWFGDAYVKGYRALWSGPRFVTTQPQTPARPEPPILDEEDDPYAPRPLAPNPPQCPAHYAEATGPCGQKELMNVRCELPEGSCACAPPRFCGGAARPPPPPSAYAWRCEPWPPPIRPDGCPGRQPRMGTSCRGKRHCAYSQGCAGVVIACERGHWQIESVVPPPP